MSTVWALVLMIVLLVLNAVFVAAEFALVTVRRDQLEPLVQRGKWSARVTMGAVKDVNTTIAGTQLGITACSIGIGAVGEPALARLLEAPFEALGLPEALVHPVALVIALAIVVYLHMVLAEMVPKNIAIAQALPASLVLGPFMRAFCWITKPLLWLMNTTAILFLRLINVEAKDEVAASFDRDQVRAFIEESGREGLLDADEAHLLAHALDFETGTAADVALPAERLRNVSRHATIREVEKLSAETGYSRFPVESGDGDFLGYLHVKDLLVEPNLNTPAVPRFLNPLPSVPADAGLREVVRRMQRSQAHLAVIADSGESASVPRIIALEDVLEELVGDVRDATSPIEEELHNTERDAERHAT